MAGLFKVMLLVIKRLLSKIMLATLGYNTSISIVGSTLLTDNSLIIYISLLKGGGGVFLDKLLLGLVFYNLLTGIVELLPLLVCRFISTYQLLLYTI